MEHAGTMTNNIIEIFVVLFKIVQLDKKPVPAKSLKLQSDLAHGNAKTASFAGLSRAGLTPATKRRQQNIYHARSPRSKHSRTNLFSALQCSSAVLSKILHTQ